MGRKSRLKKQYSARARKAINQMLKEASPEPYSKRDENGKVTVQYYNPLKKLMKGETYSSDDGKQITKDMAEKYMNFLKSKIEEKKRLESGNDVPKDVEPAAIDAKAEFDKEETTDERQS
jgi:hypothetical protein